MSIIVFQHSEDGSPGRLGVTLRDRGLDLDIRRLWLGDDVPLHTDGVDMVVSLGGPMDVDEISRYAWMQPEIEFMAQAHQREIAVVGVCLGSQILAVALGGSVGPIGGGSLSIELGWHEVKSAFGGTIDTLHTGLPWRMVQFHWHRKQVAELPPDAVLLSSSTACKVQAFRCGTRSYGFQYHFEVTRDHIEQWSISSAPDRVAADLTHEQLIRQTERQYRKFAQFSDRLCQSIADYLIPVD